TALILTALGAVVAFRSGVLNIGIEGQLLAGAAAAAAVGPALGGATFVVRLAVCLAAALAGAVATLPAAWLSEKRRRPEVLTTLLLTILAAAAVVWLVRGPLHDPSGDYPQSRALSDAVRLGQLVPGLRTSAAFPIALLLAAAVGVFLGRTVPGLKLRAV